jgi:hypothetical protein
VVASTSSLGSGISLGSRSDASVLLCRLILAPH